MSANIHLGDVGTIFEVACVDENGAVINISGASTKQILAEQPDGTIQTWTAIFSTDGTDGLMRYVTQSTGDLPASGDWKFQGYVVLSTDKFHTAISTVTIYPNVDTP